MFRSFTQVVSRGTVVALVAAGASLSLASLTPAHAGWWETTGEWRGGFYVAGPPVYVEPRYYVPPPVYVYAAPPSYYVVPPPYYGPYISPTPESASGVGQHPH